MKTKATGSILTSTRERTKGKKEGLKKANIQSNSPPHLNLKNFGQEMANIQIYSTTSEGLGRSSILVICMLHYTSGSFWCDHEDKHTTATY